MRVGEKESEGVVGLVGVSGNIYSDRRVAVIGSSFVVNFGDKEIEIWVGGVL